MDFVHLHVHSDGSLLDSSCTPQRLLEGAQRLQMKTLALTDQDSLRRAVEFFQLAPLYGIRPILGIELSCFHHNQNNTSTILLLVEEKIGYFNLLNFLNSASLKDPSFIGVNLEEVLKNSAGLCALVGSKESEIGTLLLAEKEEEAEKALADLKEAFGERLLLELQWHKEKEEREIIRKLLPLSQKEKIPLVATCDVHYLSPDEERLYAILNCIRTSTREGETHFKKKRTAHRHLASSQEMQSLFSFYPQALENASRLSERLRFRFSSRLQLPSLGKSQEEEAILLQQRCLQRLPSFYPSEREALPRLEMELKVIGQMGYAGYFLLVSDLVEEAKRRGIYVLGRGSAASSLVSYILGITLVDPLRENLLFERFLNTAREGDPPDIDLDIERDRRSEMIDYLIERYGADRVVHVGGLNTFRLQGALREVGKALGKTTAEIDYFIRSLRSSKPESKEGRAWLQYARSLEGLIHHPTTHPSGFVITGGAAKNELPLQICPEGISTQYDMYALRDLGFLKMDFIGSRNLGIIHKTLENISSGEPSPIPLDDQGTWEMIASGETLGCFQLESAGMRSLLSKLKPQNISELTVALSLYRPGPIQGGMVDAYIRRHHKEEEISYLDEKLSPILEETLGVVLYQEQVMRIAFEIGGFSMTEAEVLRRAMSDKDRPSLSRLKERFLEGAQKKEIRKAQAERIFELLEKFAGYGFNKAHSASYALVAYQTAYLKRHYPKEFFSVLLSTEEGYYPPFLYVQEAKRRGVPVFLPEINKSLKDCRVEGKGVRLGFKYIKDLGEAQIEEIISRRPKDGFQSFEDVIAKLYPLLDRKALESLICSGALETFDLPRSTLLSLLPYLLKRRRSDGDLFPSSGETPKFLLQSLSLNEELRLSWEKSGVFLPINPLEIYKEALQPYTIDLSARLEKIPVGSSVRAASLLVFAHLERTRRDQTIGFLTLQDTEGEYEAVLFYPQLLGYLRRLNSRSIILIEGQISEHKGTKSLIVREFKVWKEGLGKGQPVRDRILVRK